MAKVRKQGPPTGDSSCRFPLLLKCVFASIERERQRHGANQRRRLEASAKRSRSQVKSYSNCHYLVTNSGAGLFTATVKLPLASNRPGITKIHGCRRLFHQERPRLFYFWGRRASTN